MGRQYKCIIEPNQLYEFEWLQSSCTPTVEQSLAEQRAVKSAYLRVGVLRLDVGDDDVDHAGEVDGAGPLVDGLQKPLQQTLTAYGTRR